jgi:peptide subunit release factor 1 (eRF1)
MAKTTHALETPLRDQLDRLAAFEPTDAPVLSLYLDMRADEHGSRGRYEHFLRKVFPDRSRGLRGEARKSFDRDVERITMYLAEELQPATNGVAFFACSGASNFFEAVQLSVPLEQSSLFIGSVPHLYPLARLNDQYPRYAALLVDTNAARLFVFGLGTAEAQREVRNVKTRRTSMGGTSQARYQRHISNFHLLHMKEVVDVLDRVVRDDAVEKIIVSCDPVTMPTLMEQMPKHLAEKVVDIVHLDITTPEHQVLTDTLETMRERDAQTDSEHVERLLNAWHSGGLGVVGPEDTMDALAKRQVEELLITATPALLRRAARLPVELRTGSIDIDTPAANGNVDPEQLQFADELVSRAQQQSARLRFIEDPALLAEVGGVGALLRFKI